MWWKTSTILWSVFLAVVTKVPVVCGWGDGQQDSLFFIIMCYNSFDWLSCRHPYMQIQFTRAPSMLWKVWQNRWRWSLFPSEYGWLCCAQGLWTPHWLMKSVSLTVSSKPWMQPKFDICLMNPLRQSHNYACLCDLGLVDCKMKQTPFVRDWPQIQCYHVFELCTFFCFLQLHIPILSFLKDLTWQY